MKIGEAIMFELARLLREHGLMVYNTYGTPYAVKNYTANPKINSWLAIYTSGNGGNLFETKQSAPFVEIMKITRTQDDLVWENVAKVLIDDPDMLENWLCYV